MSFPRSEIGNGRIPPSRSPDVQPPIEMSDDIAEGGADAHKVVVPTFNTKVMHPQHFRKSELTSTKNSTKYQHVV